jgi:hypothetical protein
MFLPQLTESHELPMATMPEVAYLQLASCPRCSSRRRSLVEAGDRLAARCLGCGDSLRSPLGTERSGSRVRLVHEETLGAA